MLAHDGWERDADLVEIGIAIGDIQRRPTITVRYHERQPVALTLRMRG